MSKLADVKNLKSSDIKHQIEIPNSSTDKSTNAFKMWRCTECVCRFTDTKNDMQKHLESNHKIERNYAPLCENDFNTVPEATDHLVWRCKKCIFDFIDTGEILQKHLGTKHEVKEGLCLICYTRFMMKLGALNLISITVLQQQSRSFGSKDNRNEPIEMVSSNAGEASNVSTENLSAIGNNSDVSEVKVDISGTTAKKMEKWERSTLAERISENMVPKESITSGEENAESKIITLELKLDKDNFTETQESGGAHAKNGEGEILYETGSEIGVIEKQESGKISVERENQVLCETDNKYKTDEVTESGGKGEAEKVESDVTKNKIPDGNKGNIEANTEGREAETPHEIRNAIEVTEIPKSSQISTSEIKKSITPNESLHKHKETEVQPYGNRSSEKKCHVPKSDEDEITEALGHCKISGERTKFEASSSISEIPFNCDTCKITFISRDLMKLHSNEMHPRYKCSVCSKMFFDKLSLKSHYLRWHQYMKFCVLCESKADSNASLLQHYRITHGGIINESKAWRCKKCNISIPTEEGIQQHFTEMHKVEGTSCPICHWQFLGTDEVVDHMRSLHVRLITETSCTICRLICGNTIQLILHYLDDHGSDIQKQCVFKELLGKELQSPETAKEAAGPSQVETSKEVKKKHIVNIHTSLQKGKFECHVCLTRFKRDVQLVAHLGDCHNVQVLPPEGEHQKRFLCPKCRKRFETKELALEHVRKGHVDSFRCMDCMAYFHYEEHLKRHFESSCTFFYHQPILEEYSCRYCHSQMPEYTLRSHTLTCSKFEGPLRCRYCLDSFSSKELLDSHKNMRHPEQVEADLQKKEKYAKRVVPCPICSLKFPSKEAVIMHSKSKHPALKLGSESTVALEEVLTTEYDDERTYSYKCPVCTQSFSSIPRTEQHIREAHKQLEDQMSDCVTLGLFDSNSEVSPHNSNISPSGNDRISGSDGANKENDQPGSSRRNWETSDVIADTETESKAYNTQQFNNQNMCDISYWSLRCRFCFEPFSNRQLRESHECKRHPKQMKQVMQKAEAKKVRQSNPCVTTCPICKKDVKSEGSLEQHSYVKHPVIKLRNGSAVLLETALAEESHLNHYECPFCENVIIKNIATIKNHFEKEHSGAISDAASIGLFYKDSEGALRNATVVGGVSVGPKNASGGVYDTPNEHDRPLKVGEVTKVDECVPTTSSIIDFSCQYMSKSRLKSNESSSYNLPGPSNESLHNNDKIQKSGEGSADGLHEDNQQLSKSHGKTKNRKQGKKVCQTGQIEGAPQTASGTISCPICNRRCKSRETFLQHAKIKHPAIKLGGDPAVPLEEVLTTLYEDEKIYYRCPLTPCLDSFLKVHNVATHIYKRHEDKSYLMSDCVSLGLFEKETGRQANKKYQVAFCPICKKGFISEKGVIEHAAYKHPAIKLENAPPLPLNSVLRTRRSGPGQKIHYECPFCIYTAPGIDTVTHHIFKKHNDRAHQMSDCVSLGLFDDGPEETVSRFTLCPICKADIKSYEALRNHVKNKHPAIKLQNGSTVLLETIPKNESDHHLDHHETPFCENFMNKNIPAIRYHFEKEDSGAISDGVSMELSDKPFDSAPQNASIRENDGVLRSDEMRMKNECFLYNRDTSSIVDSNYQDTGKHILRSGGTSSYNLPGPSKKSSDMNDERFRSNTDSADNFYEDNKLQNQKFSELGVSTHIVKKHEDKAQLMSDFVNLRLFDKQTGSQVPENPVPTQAVPYTTLCPLCYRTFTSEKGLMIHAQMKHPAIKLGDKNPVPLETALTTLCEDDKIYYKCPFSSCVHSFLSVSDVAKHITKRHKDLAYQLSDCVSLGLFEKDPVSSQERSSRITENTETRPLPRVKFCQICQKVFKSDEAFRQHTKSKHPITKLFLN